MNQTTHFFDLGYGWLCKHCSAEDTERMQLPESPATSPSLALASWTDSARRTLICPRCGIEDKPPARLVTEISGDNGPTGFDPN